MFRGVAQISLDSKGRLAVPSRYREALMVQCAGRLVITADFDKCLLLYPRSRVGADSAKADGAFQLESPDS